MYTLEAKIRTEDARTTREHRMIPAVLYGKDVPSTKICLAISEFIKIYREAGQSQLISLIIDGKKQNTLVQEVQRHPVRGDFLHVDFLKINMKSLIEVSIPIVLIGTSPAILAGGQMNQSLDELTVKCLPGDIVESFELDVSGLEIGHSLHVSDIILDKDKFDVQDHEEEAVVSASIIKQEEEEEIVEEETEETEATETSEQSEEK